MNRLHCFVFVFFAPFALLASLPAAAAFTECDQVGAPASPPLVINDPGVYCLVEDIEVSITSGHAVVVSGDDILLDLNGHTISNVDDPGTSGGVFVYGQRSEVVDGTITGFRIGLESLCEGGAGGHLLERLWIDHSTFTGALLDCPDTVFRRNVVTHTGDLGTSWAYGVSVHGDRIHVVDNSVLETFAGYRSVAINGGSGSQGSLVIGNRMTSAHWGVYSFGPASDLRCRDNVTSEVSVGYPVCTDLGNNH